MQPFQYYAISVGVCVVHLAIVIWALWKLPLRSLHPIVRVLACLLYLASCYIFFFVYKPHFFIEGTLVSMFCGILFVGALWNVDRRTALFLGITLTLCYLASRMVVIFVAVMAFSVNIGQMEATPWLRCLIEGLGALIAIAVIGTLRGQITEASNGDIPAPYIALLLQPLLIELAVSVWMLPTIDGRSPVMPYAPTVVMAVAELSVITATVAILYSLAARHRASEVSHLEAIIEAQHDALMAHSSTDDAVERITHDIKNHLSCIGELGTSKEIEDHIKGIDDELYSLRRYPYTGNGTLDIILNEKVKDARRDGIDLQILMDFSGGDFLSGFDISAIFGNALDNAMRAVCDVEDPQKRIVTIKSTCISGMLVIRVTNYFATALVWKGNVLLSTKRSGKVRGYGLRSIEHSLAKYGGRVEVSEDGDLFSLSIAIPIPTSTEDR